jgi:hypothetical protein
LDEVFEFQSSELALVRRKQGVLGGILGTAFVFEHRKDNYPRDIRFWTFKPKEFSDVLKQLGYHVA